MTTWQDMSLRRNVIYCEKNYPLLLTQKVDKDENMLMNVRKAQLLEAGKGKGMDSFLKPPEDMQSCGHLGFSPLRLIADF